MNEPINLYEAYKTIPVGERYCTSCNHPILSNLFLFDGELYHGGCLKNFERFGEAVAICRGCFSYLTNKNVVRVTYDGHEEKSCGVCGHPSLRFLKNRMSRSWDSDEAEVLM